MLAVCFSILSLRSWSRLEENFAINRRIVAENKFLTVTADSLTIEIPAFSQGEGKGREDAEAYELTDSDTTSPRIPSARSLDKQCVYEDGSSIDWLREDALDRERKRRLRSQHGWRGLVAPILESAKLWVVILLTGIGVGVTGAWLDVLVEWYVLLSLAPRHF